MRSSAKARATVDKREDFRLAGSERFPALSPSGGQPRELHPQRLPPDIAFLAERGVAAQDLVRVARLSASRGIPASQELLAGGFEPRRYWSLLADDLGIAFADHLQGAEIVANAGLLATDAVRLAASVMARVGGDVLLVLAPQPQELALLRRHLSEAPALAARLRIATPETIRAFLVAHRHGALTHYAVNRLAQVMPPLSARRLPRGKGASGTTALVAATLALALLAPVAAAQSLALLSTLFFVNCSIWKLAAALRRVRPLRLEPVFDRALPDYTVLVPLYREAAIASDLVKHMKRIDYPRSKLQILLIVEADDRETRAALARHADAPPFEIVVVPPGEPRTKPKALTYALAFARGELVVVFDAEDRPEPDQLRRAAAAFRERPELGCVQARLTPDNEGELVRAHVHARICRQFRRDAAGAGRLGRAPAARRHLQPFSARAARQGRPPGIPTTSPRTPISASGWRASAIESPRSTSRTFEEAPVTFRQWLPQRRRWIKGWMQTMALCLGSGIPRGLRLRLGQWLAVHGILTAGVLGLLLYPLSLAIVAGRRPQG